MVNSKSPDLNLISSKSILPAVPVGVKLKVCVGAEIFKGVPEFKEAACAGPIEMLLLYV